jgi:ubiquinone/menaquinone biosynthesis C-methylase UbiE
MAQPAIPMGPDYSSVTDMQQRTWATGDFSVVARSVVPVSEALVAAVDPHAGQRVLDVACGSGNAALTAARRYCDVIGVDYVPALLDRARERAAVEGIDARFELGDAQALPFADGQFDCAISTFGVMFAPDQAKAAHELVRVTRSGAMLGLASWTPDGGIGELFRIVSRFRPAPVALEAPTRWGTEAGLRALFGSSIRSLRTLRRFSTQCYRSIDHAVEVFRTYFGPTRVALQGLDDAGQLAFVRELEAFFGRENRATDGTLVMRLEYLEALIIMR